jgi:hypothetical protein
MLDNHLVDSVLDTFLLTLCTPYPNLDSLMLMLTLQLIVFEDESLTVVAPD